MWTDIINSGFLQNSHLDDVKSVFGRLKQSQEHLLMNMSSSLTSLPRKYQNQVFNFLYLVHEKKKTAKSNSSVLQEALVCQAYCIATDFQTLVNFPESKTKNSV